MIIVFEFPPSESCIADRNKHVIMGRRHKQQCRPENGGSNDLKKEGQSRIPIRDMSCPPMDHIQ